MSFSLFTCLCKKRLWLPRKVSSMHRFPKLSLSYTTAATKPNIFTSGEKISNPSVIPSTDIRTALTILKSRLAADLKAAMKAKDKPAQNTIKSLLSDFIYAEKVKGGAKGGPSALIRKAISRREEASLLFRKENRADLAEKEEHECSILAQYLPPQWTREQVEQHVLGACDRLGIQLPPQNSKAAVNQVLKVVMTEIDVAVAPRAMISQVVAQILSA